MTEEIKSKEGKNVEVVEKRVKPTVIRRRAKKVAAPPPPEPPKEERPPMEASVTPGEAPAAPEAALPQGAEAAEGAPPSAEEGAPTPEGEGPATPMKKPTEEERKIGVVGHIDLSTTQPVRIKEDWRERLRRFQERNPADDLKKLLAPLLAG